MLVHDYTSILFNNGREVIIDDWIKRKVGSEIFKQVTLQWPSDQAKMTAGNWALIHSVYINRLWRYCVTCFILKLNRVLVTIHKKRW